MKKLKIKNVILQNHKQTICIPITAKNMEELMKVIDEMKQYKIEMIEFRLDTFEYIDDIKVVKEAIHFIHENFVDSILLTTFRSVADGGNREFSDEAYVALYKQLIDDDHIDMIDVEYRKSDIIKKELYEYIKTHHKYMILSYHDFNKTLPYHELIDLFEQMSKDNSDIVKVAMMPRSNRDILSLLQAMNKCDEIYDRLYISMSMGEMGCISRVIGDFFGSCVTFSSIQNASAPGQIDYPSLLRIMESLETIKRV